MMEGKIIVESEYGKGTVFMIMIPIVEGDKDHIEHLQKEKTKHNLSAPSADILVVDDNEFNLKVACGLLGLLKIKAITASSGKEAIELVQKRKFDIIFMDHMMPEMDGIEATSIIRKLGNEYESIPIIALTANAVQGAKEMFLANGMNGFVSKPIDVNVLNATLLEWLPQEKIKNGSAPEKPADSKAVEFKFIEALNNIEGINIEVGLNNFSGVESMYRETFELFYRDIAKKCEEMSAALSGGDLRSFSIFVHAMKSALATVGAMELSEAAFELETASKNDGADFCADTFPDFKEKLLSLQKYLSGIFPDLEAQGQKKAADASVLHESIQRALVAADDLDNYAGIEVLKNLLSYDFKEEMISLLKETIKAFEELDFDKAKEILNKVENV
jgi:CheY-like chemotaxis protein